MWGPEIGYLVFTKREAPCEPVQHFISLLATEGGHFQPALATPLPSSSEVSGGWCYGVCVLTCFLPARVAW